MNAGTPLAGRTAVVTGGTRGIGKAIAERLRDDGAEVWVTSEIGGSTAVIDVASRKVLATIYFDLPGMRASMIQPVGVRLTADGKKAYIALGPSNHVAVVNAETYEVEDYLLVGKRVWQLAFSPDERRLYTTNGASNDISVIDTETDTVLKSVPVGRYPWGVVVSPE